MEIKSMRPIFKSEILIYQSKANLDEKICLVKLLIIYTQKLAHYSMFWNEDSTFHSVHSPLFTSYQNLNSISETENVNFDAT